MKTFTASNYQKLLLMRSIKPIDKIKCLDHLGGFCVSLDNEILEKVTDLARELGYPVTFYNSYFFDDRVLKKYPQLRFRHCVFHGLQAFENYNMHPPQTFSKFLCSFNGSAQVGRQFLTAALQRWGYFDPESCSKNFQCTQDKIDGHLADYLDLEQLRLYQKFFIANAGADFFTQSHSFGHNRFDHAANIHHLADKIARCFLHVVSETLATSYYPFVTEKFLYSVVTRGLFVAYAQPGWHEHLERYFGFKPYRKIFNYQFDQIQNPVERLVELMSMISKFSMLSSEDWRDLYEIEKDVVEYNYDHYFSKNYIKQLETFC